MGFVSGGGSGLDVGDGGWYCSGAFDECGYGYG